MSYFITLASIKTVESAGSRQRGTGVELAERNGCRLPRRTSVTSFFGRHQWVPLIGESRSRREKTVGGGGPWQPFITYLIGNAAVSFIKYFYTRNNDIFGAILFWKTCSSLVVFVVVVVFLAIATETIARYIPAPLPGGGSPLSREHLKEIHAPPTRFKYFCTYKNI